MVGKKTVPDEMITEWLAHRDSRLGELGEGTSLWQIAEELTTANLEPCTISGEPVRRYTKHTIYRYLNPATMVKHRSSCNRSYHRRIVKPRDQRAKAVEYERRYRAEHVDEVRRYDRSYRRLTRASSQPRIIGEVFGPHTVVTLEQATEAIRAQLEGVQFKHSTIERVLKDFELGQREGRISGPPFLYEQPPGHWHYSGDQPPAHQRS